MEMGDKEEETLTRVTQINLQQLRILARSMNFTEEEVEKAGIKSKLLKMVLRKLSSTDFDTPEGKQKLCEIHEFVMSAPVESSLKKSPIDIKPLNVPLPFTPLQNSPNSQTFLKLKDFKIDGKIGTPGQKEKLTFASLSYQIQNAKSKGYTENEICDAVLKCISPELPLRSYLESKPDLNLTSLSNILRAHFKETNSFKLFTELSNAKQTVSESAYEFVIRLLSLRQKITFVSKQEDSNSFSSEFLQEQFLHSVLTGLKNENIRNELRPYLKQDQVLDDEKLLERLNSAVTDENEKQQKFLNVEKKPEVKNINVDEIGENAKKEKKMNPLCSEVEALRVTVNELVESHNRQYRSRVSKPKLCKNCIDKNAKTCNHCFFCGSSEHLQIGCLKKRNQKQKN